MGCGSAQFTLSGCELQSKQFSPRAPITAGTIAGLGTQPVICRCIWISHMCSVLPYIKLYIFLHSFQESYIIYIICIANIPEVHYSFLWSSAGFSCFLCPKIHYTFLLHPVSALYQLHSLFYAEQNSPRLQVGESFSSEEQEKGLGSSISSSEEEWVCLEVK